MTNKETQLSNKEILEKAIHKNILRCAVSRARDNGWSGSLADKVGAITDEDTELLLESGRNTYHLTPENFIFNHHFAKALWPRPYVCSDCGNALDEPHKANNPRIADDTLPHVFTVAEWRYHLQNMVVAEDPVAYLGENI